MSRQILQAPVPPSHIHMAIDALRRFDRRSAAALMKEHLRVRKEPGDSWRSVATLANRIGEIDIAIEAMRRFAMTPPQTLERTLEYCSELATKGRFEQCLAKINELPPAVQSHTAIVHLRATIATQTGDFDVAEPLMRKTIEMAPLTGQNWLSLSVIKKFKAGDPEIAHMESLRRSIRTTHATSQATFFYALGKAYHDTKDFDRAFAAYSEGAAIKRAEEAFGVDARNTFVRQVINDYTPANLDRFIKSGCDSDRAIFVTGLPRSGTTLVEQILTSHSAVSGGAELNLFLAALMPATDFSYAAASASEARAPATADPWGDIGRDYMSMLDQRFGKDGRIVDKTLNHSRFMGLILHVLPKSKVVWLRRNPEDNALSVFRNYFAAPLPWSWSMSDIGHYFKMDDALHAHWATVIPDRILTVPYEEMVSDPRPWISKILTHVDLSEEEGAYSPHKQEKRSVLTASVAQVREPISSKQVGAAQAYDKFMGPFRDAYFS